MVFQQHLEALTQDMPLQVQLIQTLAVTLQEVAAWWVVQSFRMRLLDQIFPQMDMLLWIIIRQVVLLVQLTSQEEDQFLLKRDKDTARQAMRVELLLKIMLVQAKIKSCHHRTETQLQWHLSLQSFLPLTIRSRICKIYKTPIVEKEAKSSKIRLTETSALITILKTSTKRERLWFLPETHFWKTLSRKGHLGNSLDKEKIRMSISQHQRPISSQVNQKKEKVVKAQMIRWEVALVLISGASKRSSLKKTLTRSSSLLWKEASKVPMLLNRSTKVTKLCHQRIPLCK